MLWLVSCSSVFVTIRSDAMAPSRGAAVFVIPHDDTYEKLVEKALSDAGYVIVRDISHSKLVVSFKYQLEWNIALSSGRQTNGFDRTLTVIAYPYDQWKHHQTADETWRCTIRSFGRLADWNRLFPILLRAAIPYFGKPSNGQKELTLREEENRLNAAPIDIP